MFKKATKTKKGTTFKLREKLLNNKFSTNLRLLLFSATILFGVHYINRAERNVIS